MKVCIIDATCLNTKDTTITKENCLTRELFPTFAYFVPLALFKSLSVAGGILTFVFKIFQLKTRQPEKPS